ncbi:hypothetical protein T484DRAFT_1878369, partial [Baffinella frigidus]
MGDEGPHRLFISGMSFGRSAPPPDAAMIRAVFGQFGEVTSLQTGMKDFAFIDFSDRAGCQRAIQAMNKRPFDEHSSGLMNVHIADVKRDKGGSHRSGAHNPHGQPWANGQGSTQPHSSPHHAPRGQPSLPHGAERARSPPRPGSRDMWPEEEERAVRQPLPHGGSVPAEQRRLPERLSGGGG